MPRRVKMAWGGKDRAGVGAEHEVGRSVGDGAGLMVSERDPTVGMCGAGGFRNSRGAEGLLLLLLAPPSYPSSSLLLVPSQHQNNSYNGLHLHLPSQSLIQIIPISITPAHRLTNTGSINISLITNFKKIHIGRGMCPPGIDAQVSCLSVSYPP